MNNVELMQLREQVKNRLKLEFLIYLIGVLRFKDQLCISVQAELRQEILIEVHITSYFGPLGNTKMYQDLKEHF